MNAAQELFSTLQQFRLSDPTGTTGEQRFLSYCNSTLGNVERLHFDFKCKSDPSVPILGPDDRKNLAKAVSGFANSEGGVLIWGISDSTGSPQPIAEVQRFAEQPMTEAARTNDPVVRGIDAITIASDSDPARG